jgi:four helix bundle protein
MEKFMAYKFEKLEVWQLALTYSDSIYQLAEKLPRSEEYNLKSQITRAATSIALNIAEGSTSQSDAEQARFVGMAIRSLIETVACQHLIHRRNYISDVALLRECYRQSETLFAKLQSFRTALNEKSLREEPVEYHGTAEENRPQTADGGPQIDNGPQVGDDEF